jgi:hypothetical protein
MKRKNKIHSMTMTYKFEGREVFAGFASWKI